VQTKIKLLLCQKENAGKNKKLVSFVLCAILSLLLSWQGERWKLRQIVTLHSFLPISFLLRGHASMTWPSLYIFSINAKLELLVWQ
jgi:hypothetical protein